MNVFLKIGEWLERKPLAVRVDSLDKVTEKNTADIKAKFASIESVVAAQNKELVELKEYVAKMAMYTGMRQLGKAPEDIREAITAWGQIATKK